MYVQVQANFGVSFSLHFLNIFVHISGSIRPITLMWVSLERSSPPAAVEHRWCQFWSKVMTSEVEKGQGSSRPVRAGMGVNGLMWNTMYTCMNKGSDKKRGIDLFTEHYIQCIRDRNHFLKKFFKHLKTQNFILEISRNSSLETRFSKAMSIEDQVSSRDCQFTFDYVLIHCKGEF